ncbi:hypothetical protein [Kitasatospora sp. CB01950]|uniref:hypothetical protein n=1 Tax=Kitasatospora sp. CB01950 TaxID=1703930 RepID=UPI00093E413C|nr:hypothetical protein [Kitasatospora sp. CB01950]OKJ06813.1 hypothetical protein AMK19_23450 [Kitasatospora sp. CB01950]
MITPGQIYTACDPRSGTTIRIISYTPGDARAHVVDAITGKRPRQILAVSLHLAGTGAWGKPRRTGYRLVSEASE